jgi:ArsR family transcriptional regulator, nickel/cobalt-responsive transcriptional repressor
MNDSTEFKKCAAQIKAIAEPTRLRIVKHLLTGPCHVLQLCDDLDVRMVNMSHHLGILRHAKIVQRERQGKFLIYSLPPAVVSKKSGRLNLGCCSFEL